MRRLDKEITDNIIIDEILTKSKICRVAFFDSEFPYIVPFNYAYFDDELLFHSAKSGKKIDLIKKNNNVCFEIEYYSQIIEDEQSCKWTTKYRSVIGFGEIDVLTNRDEKIRGLDAIMSHYGRTEGLIYNEKHLENIAILRLKIMKLSGKQSGDWATEKK